MTATTFVIAGGGLAGATAAATLRSEGFEGRIVLVADEDARPYERPELSKKYLRGEPGVDVFVHADDFYRRNAIELLTGASVTRIDVAGRSIETAGDRIRFDRCLVATGAQPRSLAVPGADLDGVVSLRTIGDADRIRERAMAASAIVVIGGGWIGSEVAASLRELGREVTLVLPERMPLERVLGPEVGAVYRDVHEAHGVALASGTRVTAIGGNARVTHMVTDDGRSLPAELVVVGIGAEPSIELARAAGIATGQGIVTDALLESSDPGIYAAGDVAEAWHPFYGRRLRIEHWDNAKRQGRAAALNMLGRQTPYDRIPYFYSDQYELGMEYTGFAPSWDEVVFRGRPETHEFIAFWLHGGRVVAGMNMNVWDVAPGIERLIRSGATIDPRALADPDLPLADLVPVVV
jgi:3-phenylpropionate/trans-cinnamate dioxygenase ferredoxin reductase component